MRNEKMMMREIHMSVRIVDRVLNITRKEKKASYFKPMIRLWFKKNTRTGTSFTVFNFTTANHNHTLP